MRTLALVLGCLLLVGCGTPEITGAGSLVRVTMRSNEPPAGCHMVGTIREAEGGGLRSFADNRLAAETRLRNEAGRIGGNTVAVIDEARGDTDLGLLQFSSGVQGMTTPNTACTNCVALTAHVFQCEGSAAPSAAMLPAPRPPEVGCEKPAAASPTPPPAAAPPVMPAPAVTVIILPPPQIFMPPQYQPPPPPVAPTPQPQPDDERR
jgi:hypothetical protein